MIYYYLRSPNKSKLIVVFELIDILHIAKQLSDLFVESLSDTAERETRIQLAALNNYPGRRKKNRRPIDLKFSLRPLVAASRITYGIA